MAAKTREDIERLVDKRRRDASQFRTMARDKLNKLENAIYGIHYNGQSEYIRECCDIIRGVKK